MLGGALPRRLPPYTMRPERGASGRMQRKITIVWGAITVISVVGLVAYLILS
jgi:hypothetical protein